MIINRPTEQRTNQRKLRRRQIVDALDRMGLNEDKLTTLGLKNQAELIEIQRRASAKSRQSLSNPDELLKPLLPGARQFSRDRNVVFYKPDPFGPVDIQTDGPRIDPVVPSATVPICRVTDTTILDTNANRLNEVDYQEGSDDLVEERSGFDNTPGANLANFDMEAIGTEIDSQSVFLFASGFRFNFTPLSEGQFVFRPTTVLAGSWSCGNGGISPLPFTTSLSLGLRLRVSQFGTDDPLNHYAHKDIVLLDEVVNDFSSEGIFNLETPSTTHNLSVSTDLVEGIRAHVIVQFFAKVKLNGFAHVLINASDDNTGLRVPEVHVDTLDCTGRIRLDDILTTDAGPIGE